MSYSISDMIMSAQDYITNRVNKRAQLEADILLLAGEHNVSRQLAEECCELAQACIKFQRTLDIPSDTPLTRQEATAMLIEEFTDVLVCARVLGLMEDSDLFDAKLERWKGRLMLALEGEKNERQRRSSLHGPVRGEGQRLADVPGQKQP